METRKLQMVGGGTYTVSIPKEWATDQSLEAGTPVHLYTHRDGSIVLRSARKDGGDLEAAHVEVDGECPELVSRSLHVVHALGVEQVTLIHGTAFTDAQRRAVHEAIRGLVGASAAVAGDDEIVVRNLLDASDVSVHQSVDQLGFVARSLHRGATEGFLAADSEAHLTDRAAEARRLFDMVSRHLNRALVSLEEVDRLDTTRAELFDYFVAAQQLERVCEQGVRVAELGERLASPVADATAEDLRSLSVASRGVVEDATDALLHGTDADAAHDALDRHEATLARLRQFDEALFESPDDTDAVAVARLADTLRGTAEAGGEIAEVAVRAALRDQCL